MVRRTRRSAQPSHVLLRCRAIQTEEPQIKRAVRRREMKLPQRRQIRRNRMADAHQTAVRAHGMNTAQFADRHFDRPVRPRRPAKPPNDPRPRSGRSPNPAGTGAPWWWCPTVLTHRIIGSAGERGMNIEREGEHHHIPCHGVPHARHGRHTPASDSSGTSAGPVRALDAAQPGRPRRHTVKAGSSHDSPGYHPPWWRTKPPTRSGGGAAIRPARGSPYDWPDRPAGCLGLCSA